MSFLMELVYVAGALGLIVSFVVHPKTTLWCVATLAAGFAGHIEAGLLGTFIGVVVGGAVAGAVVAVWWGLTFSPETGPAKQDLPE